MLIILWQFFFMISSTSVRIIRVLEYIISVANDHFFFQSIIFYTNWGRIKRHTASISHLRGDCYGFKHNFHFISDIDLLSKLGDGGRASFARITRIKWQTFGVSRTLVDLCKGNWSEISQRRATHLRSGEWKPNSACKVQDKEGRGRRG